MSNPEGYDELVEHVSDQTARDIIAYRRKIKKPLTARAARKIASELAKVPERERDDAVDTWMNRGWQGFEASWLVPKTFGQAPQQGGAPRSFEFDTQGKVFPFKTGETAFLRAYNKQKAGGE